MINLPQIYSSRYPVQLASSSPSRPLNSNPITPSSTSSSSFISTLYQFQSRMSKRGGGVALQKDVPWRASSKKLIPKIHHSPLLRVSETPSSQYALSIMKHQNPIGDGLATEAIVEAAGPDCIVPGQVTPIRLLGLKVWPIHIDMKFMEPVGRELKLLGKFMDSAVDLMNKSFIDR